AQQKQTGAYGVKLLHLSFSLRAAKDRNTLGQPPSAVQRSEAPLFVWGKPSRAALDRTAEGGCPHVHKIPKKARARRSRLHQANLELPQVSVPTAPTSGCAGGPRAVPRPSPPPNIAERSELRPGWPNLPTPCCPPPCHPARPADTWTAPAPAGR